MTSNSNGSGAQPRVGPPSFDKARNRRQKIRAAGLDPNYWYPVLLDAKLKKGQVKEVVFWKTSIAIYRDANGELHAMANRCAHRQLRLSAGIVDGCKLICQYHGWVYDGDGRVIEVKHDLFGKPMPKLKLRSYPVKVRYGLIWIFPGDAEQAEQRELPTISALEGPDRWACVPIELDLKCHHSMIIDNVSDFTHAYLHRRFKPFSDAKLIKLEADEERVLLEYDTRVGGGRISQHFVDRKSVDTSLITLCYQYPYQWSDTDGQIRHWCFVTPIDERTTKTFFLFHFKALKVPLLPLRFPRWLMQPLLVAANRVLIRPLLGEDAWAVEEEQIGWERHYDEPIAELNPAVHEFQKLAVRKWEEYLASQQARVKGKTQRAGDRSDRASVIASSANQTAQRAGRA